MGIMMRLIYKMVDFFMIYWMIFLLSCELHLLFGWGNILPHIFFAFAGLLIALGVYWPHCLSQGLIELPI